MTKESAGLGALGVVKIGKLDAMPLQADMHAQVRGETTV